VSFLFFDAVVRYFMTLKKLLAHSDVTASLQISQQNPRQILNMTKAKIKKSVCYWHDDVLQKWLLKVHSYQNKTWILY